jgi:hypothetical protein
LNRFCIRWRKTSKGRGTQVDIDLFDAVALAAIVALMTAWVVQVEQFSSNVFVRVREQGASEPLCHVWRPDLCALSLTAVSSLREMNSRIDTEEAALGLELNSAMARLRGQVQQVGRQALLQAEMLSGGQGFRSSLNVAVAQEVHTRGFVEAYYRENFKWHMAKHPSPA